MITIDMTQTARGWGAAEYAEVQAWCIDNIGELNDGWDSSYFYSIGGDRMIFLFDHNEDATMFALKWLT